MAGQIEVFRLRHRQSSSITGEIDTGMVSILGQPYGYCRHHQTKLLTNWSMSNEKTVVYDCPLFGILATCSMNLVGYTFPNMASCSQCQGVGLKGSFVVTANNKVAEQAKHLTTVF